MTLIGLLSQISGIAGNPYGGLLKAREALVLALAKPSQDSAGARWPVPRLKLPRAVGIPAGVARMLVVASQEHPRIPP